MKQIKLQTRLIHLFGNKCTSLHINSDYQGFINVPTRKMKFCEAVDQSFKVPIRITSGNLNCPGARRSIGFQNDDDRLAGEISDNNQMPPDFVRGVLKMIPAMDGISHIDLGLDLTGDYDLPPDLFILYIRPIRITEIMYYLAKVGIKPSIPPYLLLSACGNVLANSYLNKTVSISFGCPESRKSGGIGDNEIVLGLPYKIAADILNTGK